MQDQRVLSIHFFFEESTGLRERTRLKRFLHDIFKAEKKKLSSLNYIFCSDKRLLEINRQYLKHDYFTDIISFNLASRDKPVEGEIYISVDRVRENAAKLGKSFRNELHRVMFHGALHLCGYSDKSKPNLSSMRKREDHYLGLFFK